MHILNLSVNNELFITKYVIVVTSNYFILSVLSMFKIFWTTLILDLKL